MELYVCFDAFVGFFAGKSMESDIKQQQEGQGGFYYLTLLLARVPVLIHTTPMLSLERKKLPVEAFIALKIAQE